MALRLISRSPRWSGLVVTVAGGTLPADLAPASRRQDHPTSPYAWRFRPARSLAPDAKASITSRAPRVVTIMIRPSCGLGTGEVIVLIYRIVRRNIFIPGLDYFRKSEVICHDSANRLRP